ncbi:hypothetical protein BC830DRAFT_1092616 [Chytriomyces sp. MP71]|nr:hypothetical protein BC830DRAFT_1092616 [Chytriomyces sp. MP71]
MTSFRTNSPSITAVTASGSINGSTSNRSSRTMSISSSHRIGDSNRSSYRNPTGGSPFFAPVETEEGQIFYVPARDILAVFSGSHGVRPTIWTRSGQRGHVHNKHTFESYCEKYMSETSVALPSTRYITLSSAPAKQSLFKMGVEPTPITQAAEEVDVMGSQDLDLVEAFKSAMSNPKTLALKPVWRVVAINLECIQSMFQDSKNPDYSVLMMKCDFKPEAIGLRMRARDVREHVENFHASRGKLAA